MSVLLLLLIESTKGGRNWDQFATNERLFGVDTDFDEEIYTTALDKSDPDFKRKEAAAKRMADEIERSTTTNIHVAEERGVAVPNDAKMDEEDRYSSVLRHAGKYVPPQARQGTSAGEKPPVNTVVAPQPSGTRSESRQSPTAPSAPSANQKPSAVANQKPRLTFANIVEKVDLCCIYYFCY